MKVRIGNNFADVEGKSLLTAFNKAIGEGSLRIAQSAASVQIVDLTKDYGSTRALDKLSLNVAAGEFLTLLGPSGSGKTTLLNVIAGFVDATEGELYVDASPLSSVPIHRRNFGMVFQNYALFPNMSVLDNVKFPLQMRGTQKTTCEAKAIEALEMLEIRDQSEKLPSQLSGGQQQRVALARAIVHAPRLVLMDEPLSALDRRLREQVQIELKRLHAELGCTVIYVTHDQEEAMLLSDRIAILKDGELAQIGGPQELYSQPASVFVATFLGDSNVVAVTVLDEASQVAVPVDPLCDVQFPVVYDRQEFHKGNQAFWTLRPENIRVGQDALTCEVQFDAKITEVLFKGQLLLVKTQLNGSKLSLDVTLFSKKYNSPDLSVGQTVRIGWQVKDSVMLRS